MRLYKHQVHKAKLNLCTINTVIYAVKCSQMEVNKTADVRELYLLNLHSAVFFMVFEQVKK